MAVTAARGLLACLVLAIAVLPFGRQIEIPMGLLMLLGMTLLARGRLNWQSPALQRLLWLYMAFALPMLLSLPDAIAPAYTAETTFGTLRYFFSSIAILYLAGLAAQPGVVAVPATERGIDRLLMATLVIVTLWCLDALLQFFTGSNILGYGAGRGYINGLFGEDDNLKMAFALAILLPLVVVAAFRRLPLAPALAVLLLLVGVIILSGKRVAWVTVVVQGALLALYYLRAGRISTRSMLLALTLLAVAAVFTYQTSSWVERRTDNVVAAVVHPDYDTINRALSLRLPIWEVALQVTRDHWLNGIGARGFRHIYADYARAGDRFARPLEEGGANASHPHQLLLEISSETGVIGVLCYLLLLWLLWRSWRDADATARARALPFAVSVVGMVLPINSHGAWFSSWSAMMLWLMIALYLWALYCAEHDR